MSLAKASMPTRRAFSERIAELGAEREDFAVFESDIGRSTYSYLFGERFPERYFNMGIAEVATMAAACGMASQGRPVVVCGYGVFLTMRALEVVRSFACYPGLEVKLMSSHGGITAAIDGVTHQATEDIAFMSTLPGMKVLVPADSAAARACADLALATPGPVFTRLMRDPLFELYGPGEAFRLGGSQTLRRGSHVAIAAYGDMVFQALLAADELASRGVEAEVLDLYSVKPYDREAVLEAARRTGALLVVENHQRRNGLGYEIAAALMRGGERVAFDHLGLDDTFAESGDYFRMLDEYGLGPAAIADAAFRLAARAKGR
jgi:transketolase